jgi:hypothetical protein
MRRGIALDVTIMRRPSRLIVAKASHHPDFVGEITGTTSISGLITHIPHARSPCRVPLDHRWPRAQSCSLITSKGSLGSPATWLTSVPAVAHCIPGQPPPP